MAEWLIARLFFSSPRFTHPQKLGRGSFWERSAYLLFDTACVSMIGFSRCLLVLDLYWLTVQKKKNKKKWNWETPLLGEIIHSNSTESHDFWALFQEEDHTVELIFLFTQKDKNEIMRWHIIFLSQNIFIKNAATQRVL